LKNTEFFFQLVVDFHYGGYVVAPITIVGY